jgi:dipeptidyl aminopeptidase/acylaminoacyl peptidase
VIAAVAAVAAIRPEAREARMLVQSGDDVVAIAPDGRRTRLLTGAGDAAYSPDGTLVAFSRDGDLWLANADGSGQRRLATTPHVSEWGPVWTPDGKALAYTAQVNGARQIRLFRLPTGPSVRIAAGGGEDWSPSIARNGSLALVSNRSGSPAVYIANGNGTDTRPFDTAPATTPPADVRDLAWSPDGRRLAYTVQADDGTTTIDVDDGTTQVQVGAAGGQHPVFSPRGTRIAYDDGAGALSSVAADGTDLRSLGEGRPLDWLVVPIGKPLFPNLVQRPPSGLVIMPAARGHWLLGFTSMVDNRGPGALWITARRIGSATVMQVQQRVHLRGSGVRTLPASGELHYTDAPPHYHWHFLGFDHYELRSTRTFSLLVRDRKSGFCIADHYGLAPGIRHGPPHFLGSCAQFQPKARFVEEGSSVGYTDRYPAFFHGQNVDITGVPGGIYDLVHRVNQAMRLHELRYDNDAASVRIRLRWIQGTPRVTVLKSCLAATC